jgi:hypothetical protein
MPPVGFLAFAPLMIAVGCGSAGGATDAGGGPRADGGPLVNTPTTCAIPDEGKPVVTTGATNVVGNGTPSSCTEGALKAALDTGGIITFACGSAPVTITMTSPGVINNVAGADGLGDTVIDGNNLVTLSGGGLSRILYLNACEPPFNNAHCDTFPHPHLTVQNLTFADGRDTGTSGGGAIFRHGGALTVIHAQFYRNSCATTGQDTAGGAIRLEQPTPALIVDSVFGSAGKGNTCSNGGAIGALQAHPVQIINTIIDSNSATGVGGNPGNGGNGGGLYHDGTQLDLALCGVKVTHNTGNAFGGGLFFVDNAGDGALAITNTELADNSIPTHAGQPSHGGAGYVQGAALLITNATIANDAAGFAAGLYANAMNGKGSFNATNLTVTGMAGDGLTIEGGLKGTLLNSTIASNTRGIAGAAGLTLDNSILAGNQTSCDVAAAGGTASVQSPDGSCGLAIAIQDALLGALADNGGTTGVRTMAPGAGSPARNLGVVCPSGDARGTARPADKCTSGAHQVE